MDREKMLEFFDRLEGPEGCDFRRVGKKGLKWTCPGDTDKPLARKILKKMGIPAQEVKEFLAECHFFCGHCDCEIYFNAEEPLLANSRWAQRRTKAPMNTGNCLSKKEDP